MPETTPLIKAALNLRVGVGFDVYVQMTEGKRNIIHQLLDEYDIQSAEDI